MINFVRMRKLIKAEEQTRWALEKAKSRAEKITISISKSGGGGESFRKGSRVEEGAIAISVLREEYQRISDELEGQREELKGLMKKIRTEKYRLEKLCLKMRYLKGLRARTIAEALNYSEPYIFEKLGSGERLISGLQEKEHSSP